MNLFHILLNGLSVLFDLRLMLFNGNILIRINLTMYDLSLLLNLLLKCFNCTMQFFRFIFIFRFLRSAEITKKLRATFLFSLLLFFQVNFKLTLQLVSFYLDLWMWFLPSLNGVLKFFLQLCMHFNPFLLSISLLVCLKIVLLLDVLFMLSFALDNFSL